MVASHPWLGYSIGVGMAEKEILAEDHGEKKSLNTTLEER